jgi:hypothetical protein
LNDLETTKNKKELLMIQLALISLFSLVFISCQTMPYQPYARDVKKVPNQSGVIHLKTEHRDEDRAKADMMMKKNCGDLPVKITEEGEVAIGQTTTGNATESRDNGAAGAQVGTLFGLPITTGATDPSKSMSSTTTTMAVKEWQIAYECGNTKTKKK